VRYGTADDGPNRWDLRRDAVRPASRRGAGGGGGRSWVPLPSRRLCTLCRLSQLCVQAAAASCACKRRWRISTIGCWASWVTRSGRACLRGGMTASGGEKAARSCFGRRSGTAPVSACCGCRTRLTYPPRLLADFRASPPTPTSCTYPR